MRIGLIGYGRWGRNHARILRELGALTGICETDAEARADASEDYGEIRVIECLDDLLSIVDAVVVATPIKTHADVVRTALEAGRHVLVEKPLTIRFDDAKKLADLAVEKSLVLKTGFTALHDPGLVAMQAMVAQGQVGEPITLSLQRLNFGLGERGVGVVIDTMAHDVAIVHWFLGREVEEVKAVGSFGPAGVLSEASALLSVEGTAAAITTSWVAPERRREVVVTCGDATLVWRDGRAEVYWNSLGPRVIERGRHEVLDVEPAEPLRVQTEAFIRSIERTSPGHIVVERGGPEFAVRVQQTLRRIDDFIRYG